VSIPVAPLVVRWPDLPPPHGALFDLGAGPDARAAGAAAPVMAVARAADADRPSPLARTVAAWLAAHLFGVEPASIATTSDASGRPALVGPVPPHAGLSIAHSRRIVVVAVNPGGPVGVDVEVVRPLRADVARLARRGLDPRAARDFRRRVQRGDPPDGAFLLAWTRFEARAKLDGRGVLAHVASPAPAGSARVWTVALPAPWTAPDACVGAVAVARGAAGGAAGGAGAGQTRR
jgi:hypothetical protein